MHSEEITEALETFEEQRDGVQELLDQLEELECSEDEDHLDEEYIIFEIHEEISELLEEMKGLVEYICDNAPEGVEIPDYEPYNKVYRFVSDAYEAIGKQYWR